MDTAEVTRRQMGTPLTLSVDTEYLKRGERYKNFDAYLTPRGKYDQVVQFTDVRGSAPLMSALLTECVESHFGTTDGFALDSATRDIYGLLMQGIRQRPGFSVERHLHGFLQLVDDALAQLRENECSRS